MKEDFTKFVAQGFAALKIEQDSIVYDVKEDQIPSWLSNTQKTGKYLVITKAIEKKLKIEKFFSVKTFIHENELYWFDVQISEIVPGVNPEVNSNPEPKPQPTPMTREIKDRLKTCTSLPLWLDKFIFESIGARWDADFHKFEHNLGSTLDDNLVYLGTYFPRSYAESFCIFDNLFTNRAIEQRLNKVNSVNILSLGSGTGGDLVGLLTALRKYYSQIKRFSVSVIDGNHHALDILSKILSKFGELQNVSINLKKTEMIISKFESFDPASLGPQNYHFILTSKMLSEVESNHNGQYEAYYQFGKLFLPKLSATGLCLVLDVTTQTGAPGVYYPMRMSTQLNRLIKEDTGLGLIVPLSCARFGQQCNETRCFQSKGFTVSHSRRQVDLSMVSYFVVALRNFADEVRRLDEDRRLSVDGKSYCSFTKDFHEDADPFYPIAPPLVFSDSSPAAPTGAPSTIDPPKEDAKYGVEIPGVKVVGKIKLPEASKKPRRYIIDTNIFVKDPKIVSRIGGKDLVVLSAKVVDELDTLKIKLKGEDLANAETALRNLNHVIGKGQVTMESADLELLPPEMSRKSPDNMIVALAYGYKENQEYETILMTSDNGMQLKAKGLRLTTISLADFINHKKPI